MKQKNNEQLCPKCQTGYDTYLLDNKNPFCPYIHCHNGTSCTMFKPLKENTDRDQIKQTELTKKEKRLKEQTKNQKEKNEQNNLDLKKKN